MAGALDFYMAGLDPLKQAFGATNKRALESNMPGMKPGGALGGWYDSLPMMDRQFYQDMLANLPDAARGLSAQTLGWPVDLATLAMRPLGYKTPTPVGSTDWWGQKMGADVHGLPYQITSMLPTDAGDIARGAGLLSAKYGPEMLGLLGMTAYHGSPHKFAPTEKNPMGEFDPSKIGTGQGAQSYGYGFYLAQNPGVGKGYQLSFSKHGELHFPDGTVEYMEDMPEVRRIAAETLLRNPDVASAKHAIGNWDLNWTNFMSQGDPVIKQDDVLKEIDNLSSRGAKGSAYIYKVDLPDEQIAKMLDWDKPLSEQPEAVRKALSENMRVEKAGDDYAENWLLYFGDTIIDGGKTKKELVEAFNANPAAKIINGTNFTSPQRKAASEYLNSLGIPGIKYFDEGSRPFANVTNKTHETSRYAGGLGWAFFDKKTGYMDVDLPTFPTEKEALAWLNGEKSTRNFVVFDPSIMNILERN